ncbi:MAG: GNAT family N-acetyltransferase [Alkalibacterium sp.]|nr:GNAT family N-acetyltransferase [Alkalibacterium sp.]
MASFKDLFPYSQLTDSNDFFEQFYNPVVPFRYDSNFFQLLYSPSIEEFKLIETMQIKFSEENSMNHVKFYWPQDTGILTDTLTYLNEREYGLEKLELYTISPADFKGKATAGWEIKEVQTDTLPLFKEINYSQDLEISESFAEAKQPFYDTLQADERVTLRLVFKDSEAVGSCLTIEKDLTIELDEVFILPAYRHQGAATALQNVIMKEAREKNKLVILAADAEDSPREMYQKQGYSYQGFRIGAVKTFQEVVK